MDTETSVEVEDFEKRMRRGGSQAVEEMCRFFMKDDSVYRSLVKITRKLRELNVPYAVVGGIALGAHGFTRATVDVDILVTAEGLRKIHDSLEGLGYVPPFEGSKHLRDVETRVKIEFMVTGQYPGDGKPKPVAFPDPAVAAVEIGGIQYLGLERLVELKLASGLTGGVARLKDFADVVALIQTVGLPKDFGDRLNPYVRPKFDELWQGLREQPPVD